VGDIDESKVVVTGMHSQPCERLLHVQVLALRNHSFSLFNDDAAIERTVEQFVDDIGLADCSVLENADGGDIGECLGGLDVSLLHLPRYAVKQVKCADDGAPESHRKA
jgi:hypothetical protein